MTAVRTRIAAEIRAELARQNKSHGFLAEVLDLDKSSISHRLTGRRDFRAEEIVAIAEALGVSASQFIDAPQAASHPSPTHPRPTGPTKPLPPTQPKPSNPPKSATEENGEAA